MVDTSATKMVTIELPVQIVLHYNLITDCDHVLTFKWLIIVTWGPVMGSTPKN